MDLWEAIAKEVDQEADQEVGQEADKRKAKEEESLPEEFDFLIEAISQATGMTVDAVEQMDTYDFLCLTASIGEAARRRAGYTRGGEEGVKESCACGPDVRKRTPAEDADT